MGIFLNCSSRLRSGWRLLLFVVLIVVMGTIVVLVQNLAALPNWVQSGVVQPVPQLLMGVLLLAAVLSALFVMFRFFERRELSTLGLPLTGSWISAIHRSQS